MNKKIFKMLCINFNKDANKETYSLWEEELKKYDPIYVDKALHTIIKNDKYFPTLARIIDVIKIEMLSTETENEIIDEETQKEFDEFQEFIKAFRES